MYQWYDGRLSGGELVLQMFVQNKAILSQCGDSGTTTARAIVGAVISMLMFCILCPAPNHPTAHSHWFLDNRGMPFTV